MNKVSCPLDPHTPDHRLKTVGVCLYQVCSDELWIPASFLSYTNLNGLHSNMKLFCPGDGDVFLAAAPRYTHSPDQTSHFEI